MGLKSGLWAQDLSQTPDHFSMDSVFCALDHCHHKDIRQDCSSMSLRVVAFSGAKGPNPHYESFSTYQFAFGTYSFVPLMLSWHPLPSDLSDSLPVGEARLIISENVFAA